MLVLVLPLSPTGPMGMAAKRDGADADEDDEGSWGELSREGGVRAGDGEGAADDVDDEDEDDDDVVVGPDADDDNLWSRC